MLPSVISHMNVPAPPLNGFTGTALQVPGVPGTGGGGLVGPVVGVGVGPGLVVVGLADGLPTAPVQVTPLRVKLPGTGLLEPFHVPLKPKLTVPPVPIVAS